jgi:hypothetical protein
MTSVRAVWNAAARATAVDAGHRGPFIERQPTGYLRRSAPISRKKSGWKR